MPPKRGRGRPRKAPPPVVEEQASVQVSPEGSPPPVQNPPPVQDPSPPVGFPPPPQYGQFYPQGGWQFPFGQPQQFFQPQFNPYPPPPPQQYAQYQWPPQPQYPFQQQPQFPQPQPQRAQEQNIPPVYDAPQQAAYQRPAVPGRNDPGFMGYLMKQAREMKCPEFDGQQDIHEAKNWMDTMCTAMDDLDLEDRDKVKVSSRFLTDLAKQWWDGAVSMNPEPLTWEQFKEAFCNEYYSEHDQNKMQREFFNAKQGDRTVKEWDVYLRKLIRHLPPSQQNDQNLCNKFRDGLHDEINLHLSSSTSGTTSYKKLVETACDTEEIRDKIRKKNEKKKGGFFSRGFFGRKDNKRPQQPQVDTSEQSFKKSKSSSSSDSGSFGKSVGSPQVQTSRFGRPAPGSGSGFGSAYGFDTPHRCNYCNKVHIGRCTERRRCYNCGGENHFARDCPRPAAVSAASSGQRGRGRGRNTTAAHIYSGRGATTSNTASGDRVQTRIYNMTRDAAQTNPNVISGNNSYLT